MFKLNRLVARFIALGVLLSCLGFIAIGSFAEKASASQLVPCRSCEPDPNNPGLYITCTWYVVSNCDTEPPMMYECLQSLSCDL